MTKWDQLAKSKVRSIQETTWIFNIIQELSIIQGTNSSLTEAVNVSEVWTVRLCLKQMKNEPCQPTNCNAGCVKPSLTKDTTQGAAYSLGLERFTARLANDSFKADLREPT